MFSNTHTCEHGPACGGHVRAPAPPGGPRAEAVEEAPLHAPPTPLLPPRPPAPPPPGSCRSSPAPFPSAGSRECPKGSAGVLKAVQRGSKAGVQRGFNGHV
eukprot:1194293-Prorocentrum_minimum.AAC.1